MKSSKISKSVFSINTTSTIKEFSAKFIYNFYVTDENTQNFSNIPAIYQKPGVLQKSDVNLASFSLRVPRYVELSWKIPEGELSNSGKSLIKDNLSKIVMQDDDLVDPNNIQHIFFSRDILDYAYEDIAKDVNTSAAVSQATITEHFVDELMKDYEESNQDSLKDICFYSISNQGDIKQLIKESIESIEKFADNSEKMIGYKFYDNENNKISNVFEFDKIALLDTGFYSQINVLTAKDIFHSASLAKETVDLLNKLSSNNQQSTSNLILPSVSSSDLPDYNYNSLPEASSLAIVGFIIDKYRFENNSYIKESTIFCEDASINSVFDINVKYGMTYHYAIRSIGKFSFPIPIDGKMKNHVFYIGGKLITTHVKCFEDVPPPEPVDINFDWNYKQNKFFITWHMPFNSQRDIKQFQVFRRKTINEPFELLEQQCFDFSDLKTQTGEVIDGNNNNMTEENTAFVKYMKNSTFSYNDKEFKIDTELLKSSTYIYCICSIDAHGLISNYSAQLEVTFDFFKNSLVKKLISNVGAPRPYPNMLLNVDLFKDKIQTSGMSSKKLKIYFMPEYFAVKYNDGKIQKMITTTTNVGGHYKLQIINTQNQKTDSLKINISDPNKLADVIA